TERLGVYVIDSGGLCRTTRETLPSLSGCLGAWLRKSQQRGRIFLGSHSPERTEVDDTRRPLGVARIITGIPVVEPKPQILCQAGRGGVGMLTSVTQHA